MKIFLILLGIYILYKFIVDFAIPIYKTSKRVQEQFRHMQQNGNANPGAFNGTGVNKEPASQPKASSRDYIDFEEIKD